MNVPETISEPSRRTPAHGDQRGCGGAHARSVRPLGQGATLGG